MDPVSTSPCVEPTLAVITRMQLWLPYVGVALANILSPGPAVVLAVNHGALFGPRRTLWSTLGNALGLIAHALIGALGVGVALQRAPSLLSAIQLVGAVYLAHLGIKILRSSGVQRMASQSRATSVSSALRPTSAELPDSLTLSGSGIFRRGLTTAALNPHPFVFFAALFPQFVSPTQPLAGQLALLIVTFLVLSLFSLSSYSLLGHIVGQAGSSERAISWISTVSGIAFVGFACRTFAALVT